jgi:hypothetical protein
MPEAIRHSDFWEMLTSLTSEQAARHNSSEFSYFQKPFA